MNAISEYIDTLVARLAPSARQRDDFDLDTAMLLPHKEINRTRDRIFVNRHCVRATHLDGAVCYSTKAAMLTSLNVLSALIEFGDPDIPTWVELPTDSLTIAYRPNLLTHVYVGFQEAPVKYVATEADEIELTFGSGSIRVTLASQSNEPCMKVIMVDPPL